MTMINKICSKYIYTQSTHYYKRPLLLLFIELIFIFSIANISKYIYIF